MSGLPKIMEHSQGPSPSYLNIVLSVEMIGPEPLEVRVKNGTLLDCKLLDGSSLPMHPKVDGFVAIGDAENSSTSSGPTQHVSAITQKPTDVCISLIKKESEEDTLGMSADLDVQNDSFPSLDFLELGTDVDSYSIPSELALDSDALRSTLQPVDDIGTEPDVFEASSLSGDNENLDSVERTDLSLSTHSKLETPVRKSPKKITPEAAVKQETSSNSRKKRKPVDKKEIADLIRTTNMGEKLECVKCGINTTSASVCLLQRHVRGVHLDVEPDEEDSRWKEAETMVSDDTTIKCFVCETIFPDTESLLTHISVHLVQRFYMDPDMIRLLCLTHARKTETRRPFKCIKCRFQAKKFSSLKQHITKEHLKILSTHERKELVETTYDHLFSKSAKNNVWKCNLCDYSNNQISSMKIHVHKKHFNARNANTASEDVLPSDHLEGAENISIESIKHRQTLLENFHKDRIKTLVPAICDICGYSASFKHLLLAHKATKHGISNRNFHCLNCVKVFSTSKQLKLHLKNVHAPTVMTCPHPGCLKVLRKHSIEKHVKRAHGVGNDDRPPCPQCGKLFTNKYILQDHIDGVHMGKREYICDWPGCGKKFARPWNRTVHRRIHTDEKPLQCELCGFRGRQKNSMDHHYKTAHKDYEPKLAKD